ncbi:hypothetical protein Vafri_16760 [Volvox africanus]|uniref:AMP-activated protein kinase glycogen-binding domain-containing protein n=1 Tax=Volvox africanus TaxID=51714 RepID=A0A8J4FA24_9CHLO|nr:hypothetical protein Vafri_16760 [Volvox africanus]
MGNTTSHKHEPTVAPDNDHYRHASPPISPGSPLTYSPQIPMEPISRAEDVTANRGAPEFYGVAGWPAQPKVVPVVIVWSHGGNHVEVEGSFDNWTTRQPLQKSGKDFTIIKLLPPGVYQVCLLVCAWVFVCFRVQLFVSCILSR